jgi:hypothetical protein
MGIYRGGLYIEKIRETMNINKNEWQRFNIYGNNSDHN